MWDDLKINHSGITHSVIVAQLCKVFCIVCGTYGQMFLWYSQQCANDPFIATGTYIHTSSTPSGFKFHFTSLFLPVAISIRLSLPSSAKN